MFRLFNIYELLSLFLWDIKKFGLEFVTYFHIRAIIESETYDPIVYPVQKSMFRELFNLCYPFFNITTIISFAIILKTANFLLNFKVDLFFMFLWRNVLIIRQFYLLYLRSEWRFFTFQHKTKLIIFIFLLIWSLYLCLVSILLDKGLRWIADQAREGQYLWYFKFDEEVMFQELLHCQSIGWIKL